MSGECVHQWDQYPSLSPGPQAAIRSCRRCHRLEHLIDGKWVAPKEKYTAWEQPIGEAD